MEKGAETIGTGKLLSLNDPGRRFPGGATEVGSGNSLSYVSPAGLEMSKYPFTNDQLKEVERQAMIYNNYIVSSLPVPPHLLFPVSTYFPSLMWRSRNGDPEPGRCKRTDGKKWRCSKEVAVQQKYCERHLHRGRARSRKPVEVDNVGKNRKKARGFEQSQSDVPNVNEPLLLFDAKKTDPSISYHKGSDGIVTTAEQPWHHLIESDVGLMTNGGLSGYPSNAAIFNLDYPDKHPLSNNIFSYPTFPTPEMELPIGFIDAWSVDNNPNSKKDGNLESSVSINDDNTNNTSPSLDLSMAMAYCDHDCNKSNPFSYETIARGGPLGEAVHGSCPASPSAVLHRSLFSHSDGSVCNSPTLRGPPSEVSIKWFN